MGEGDAVQLTRPDEPVLTKQRRVEALLQQLPADLASAEASEAAEAAAIKARQAELPATNKVMLLCALLSCALSYALVVCAHGCGCVCCDAATPAEAV